MAALTKLTIEISENTKTALDHLANGSDATSSELASRVIRAYVEDEADIVRSIEAGLSDLHSGRLVPHNEAMVEITALINAAQNKRK